MAATMKFGEALVRAGALTGEQLVKALDMQRILGGRLGTNLLELGYLSEGSLIEQLGRFRSTQVVKAEELKTIPAPVLRSIPAKLALRYRLVPYRVKGKTLFVASKDPGDALQEDEISFLTSFMVRTHLTLELHLEVALRRHFKAPLDQRFIALTRRLSPGAGQRSAGPGPSPATPASQPGPSSAGTSPAGRAGPAPRAAQSSFQPAQALTPPPIGTPAASTFATPAPAPAPAITGQAASTAASVRVQPRSEVGFRDLNTPEPDMEFIELDADDLALLRGGESVAPSAEAGAIHGIETTATEAGLLVEPAPRLESPWPGPAEESIAEPRLAEEELVEEELVEDEDIETRLMSAARELKAADIRDEIGDVLLGFAAYYYRRRALVIRRKEQLLGWMASGEDLENGSDAPSIRDFGVDSVAPSVFSGLQDPGSFWLGPLPLLPANRDLIDILGSQAPRDCLVLPISLRSKIIGYLYVDNLDQGVAGSPVAEMKRLVAKAGLTFEVYILKNKIRMI